VELAGNKFADHVLGKAEDVVVRGGLARGSDHDSEDSTSGGPT
jgi:hypothetical protein